MIEPVIIYTECKARDAAGGIITHGTAIWRAAPMIWRVAIYMADGSLSDLSGLDGMLLTITNAVNGGPGTQVWLEREYPAEDLNPALTPEEWADHSAWHFEGELSGEDLQIPVNGVSSDYWFMLEGIEGEELIPLAGLQITLRSSVGPALDREPLGYTGAVLFGGVPMVFGTDE